MSVITEVEELISRQKYVEQRVVELEAEIQEEERVLLCAKDARQIVTLVLANTQSRFKTDVEALMTLAVNTVFKRFEFKLNWTVKANRSELNFDIMDGNNLLNLDDDMGCSILDIVSFSSRPVFHRYQQDPSRKTLFFDEGFKWVGQGEFLTRATHLIERVAHTQKYQIIFITHDPIYANIADRGFHVTNDGERSQIGEIEPQELSHLLEK